MSALPARGELADHPLPRLLLALHAARFEGVLSLRRDPIEKSFQLQQGVPVQAESSRESEGLCRQLVATGALTAADAARVAEQARRRRCPEAAALLALELLSPRDLLQALKDQVRLRLVECFGWDRGGFELSERPAVDAARALRGSVPNLVQEGIEAHWSPDHVLADLAPQMARYPTGTPALARVAADLRRDDAVEVLLASLDGGHSLWQLLQEAGTPRALAALWVLDASGALAYAEAPVAKAEAAAAAQVEIVVGDPRRRSGRGRAAATGKREAETPRPDVSELARAIDERHARLGELDRYALLGVSRDADAAAIKRAYLAAAKLYHPDVIGRAGLDASLRLRATKLFAEIGKAYATLSDPERRRQYDLGLDGGEALDTERLATAEGLFRKGEVLLRQGNFRGALEFLEPAAELWPEEAAYQGALGWALYKKLPSEPERAREHLERAARLDPADHTLAFRLSVVLRTLGEGERSAELLQRSRS